MGRQVIPIAVLRKNLYNDYQLHLLSGHAWFLGDHQGTMSFKPDTYLSEHETKDFLKEYVAGKGSVASQRGLLVTA